MSNRLDEQKDKRKTKRYKRNSRFLIFLLIVCITSFGILSGMLYAEYEKTESWAGSDLDQQLAHIPPEFAQNTYDLGMLDDIYVLGQITDMLALIDEEAGLTDASIDVAQDVADITENLLTKNNIESGNSVQNLERLQLYIDIYHIEQTIYDTLDTEALTQIMTQLQQRVIYGESDVDTEALARMQGIVAELNALNTFVDTYHTPLGEVANATLIVPETMTRDITNDILNTIEEQSLNKFAVIQTVTNILTSPTWNRILVNNSVLREIEQWDNEWAVYNTLNKDQYRRIGAYPTLRDVQDIPWITVHGVREQPYQSVLGHSLVSKLTVNGHTVSHGQYVKKDLPVQASIDPVYQSAALPDARELPEFTDMTDYQTLVDELNDLLEQRNAQLEQERLEQERLEQEEQDRLEQEEQDQLEQEEQDRLEQEEQDRLEQEEQDRLEQEEQDRLEQEEQDAAEESESSDN